MRLGVEHPLVQGELVSVREQEVEVLERLAKEEGFHLVLRPGVQRVSHITDSRVSSANFAIFLNALWIYVQIKMILIRYNGELTWNIFHPQSW